MYKVLLVDDEQLELEGMKQFIPWGQYGMVIAQACDNAYSALQYLESHAVDVLVTDIRMPIMSGLELAEKALLVNPNLKLVFVTGYEDFHYAKKAISMNASSYVLKPVDEEELAEVLRKVHRTLQQERMHAEREQSIQRTLFILKNELLERYLKGANDPELELALMEQFGIAAQQNSVRAAVIEVDDAMWKLNEQSEAERKRTIDQLFASIATRVEEAGIATYCQVDTYRMAVVVSNREDHVSLLHRMVDFVKSQYPVTITIGLGNSVAVWSELPCSYEQAVRALSAKMFRGKCMVIEFDEDHAGDEQFAMDLDKKVENLFTAMSHYDLVAIVDRLDELFKHVQNLRDKLSIYHYSLYLITKLEVHLHTLNETIFDMLQIEWKHLNILYQFETIDDIHSWLRKRIFEISELLHNKKLRRHYKLVSEIQTYIGDRLDRALTLKEVANHFSFSPNYLGQLFKEETGESFSEYITRERMERAKKLLQNPTLKVYEVANAVGCKNMTHFSKLFKDYVGMTAGEYRKQC
ncbi:response regulator [Xylanibacillus composti]|uniref:DNA-binding response regulator n=1 Tax=Xylanibacillus composti TaxID=1572762 RepID=A0A8J4H166_9BACL|nr:response regulator [Xylanibacillus composti]MDT9725744.1 response regulator [Xylanibacillus composti]GIQ67542.1 DNA-binding response regulator [Xylanibacillus composti]